MKIANTHVNHKLNIFFEALGKHTTLGIFWRPILIMGIVVLVKRKHDDNQIVRFETCSYIHRY